MSNLLETFDDLILNKTVAALVKKTSLVSVEGAEGVVFPATFAATKSGSFAGGYNIDKFNDGTNICLIDSVGSQANRIEPVFCDGEYAQLVPQILTNIGDNKVNLLLASHRIADASIKFSDIKGLPKAFKELLKGDATAMAKIAPTSVVFGLWDSRDTQIKSPRLVASVIQAHNVKQLTRSSQYIPTVDYNVDSLLGENDNKDFAAVGCAHVPSPAVLGGVIATEGVFQNVLLHLPALRALSLNKEVSLLRYILGLSLIAFTCPMENYLRQGCNLVPKKPGVITSVSCEGERTTLDLSHAKILEYAKAAAQEFGVGIDQEVTFDPTKANVAIKASKKKAAKKKK